MKAITERLDWIEVYLRSSEPKDGDQLIKDAAWTTVQELRAIGETLPEPAQGGFPGCICPPTSEKTCQAPLYARRGLLSEVRRPDPIIRLSNG